MSDFLRMVDLTGNDLTSAGLALETIVNLLGADGSEHHLSDEDLNGLQHAVLALGSYVKNAGYELCKAVELEAAEVREGQEVHHA